MIYILHHNCKTYNDTFGDHLDRLLNYNGFLECEFQSSFMKRLNNVVKNSKIEGKSRLHMQATENKRGA